MTTPDDEPLELPSAPVCWLWWAAEPKAVRLQLLEEMRARGTARTGPARAAAGAGEAEPAGSQVLAGL